jgi:hypothetical protein
MFWDVFLDPLRDALSNNIADWVCGSILVAFVTTKVYAMVSGWEVETRQQINFGVTVFLLLVGLFYLP